MSEVFCIQSYFNIYAGSYAYSGSGYSPIFLAPEY